MRIAILTTDTPHHRYFLQRFSTALPTGMEIVLNLFETKPYPWKARARRYFWRNLPNIWQALGRNPYIQSKAQAREQIAYEEQNFFADGDREVPATFPTHSVRSVNDEISRDLLRQAAPDLILIYGTGLVTPAVFQMPPLGSLNAHGGLLPGYRGLDTNLWALVNGKAEDMAVSIHEVEADFDTGAVVAQGRLRPAPDLRLATLRYHTTILCLELFLLAVNDIFAGSVQPRKQIGESRYYGPMPLLVKRHADRLLRAYARDGELSEMRNG
jgi:folate-dependent phosphoribosylglycinamide formyltransferase PurN